MTKKVLLLPGDGIGIEIIQQTKRVLDCLVKHCGLDVAIESGLIGGAAYERHGDPYPAITKQQVDASDAVLLGAVGGYAWDNLPKSKKPETGLLALRKHMQVFANLRPIYCFDALCAHSTLKPEVIEGLDILFVRELTGGIYFGEPRGVFEKNGETVGVNTLCYSKSEIKRVAKVAFEAAQGRDKKVCSVDKANVLEVMQLWRQTVEEVAQDYPDVILSHMYVDNAAMQLVYQPKQFDVILTSNMFGDILSDCASMLTGSIGMLPSAAINNTKKGLYEPVHGSAPDIEGLGVANPIAAILSAALMLKYSLSEDLLSQNIHDAVKSALDSGMRTKDVFDGCVDHQLCDTAKITDEIIRYLL